MLAKILIPSLFAAALVVPHVAVASVDAETMLAPADAQGDSAMSAFRKQHDAVVELVDKGAAADKIQAKVDALLDFDAIAKTALGGPAKYEKRCGDRCDQFKELLTKLIRENYLKRIYAKDRGTVIYIDENIGVKGGRKVNTMVTFTDPSGVTHTVEVAYVMHKVDDTWQVRDIVTDGVSLAKNYRFEFNKLFRDGGIELVITRLQSKLTELAQAKTN